MLRTKLLPVGCALALSLPACVENDTSLFVAGVLAGKPPECEFKADPGSAQLPGGVMDVSFTTSYDAELLVGLQLATRGDKTKLRTESMQFQIRGAEVRLTDSVGDLIDEFSVPASGSITPTSAQTPGFGLSKVVLIPNDVGGDFRDELSFGGGRTVVAEVRVFGDTLGGAELTSGSFTFVIDVCYGCLVTWVEDGLNADGSCNLSISEPVIRNGCFFGQDATFDCRLSF